MTSPSNSIAATPAGDDVSDLAESVKPSVLELASGRNGLRSSSDRIRKRQITSNSAKEKTIISSGKSGISLPASKKRIKISKGKNGPVRFSTRIRIMRLKASPIDSLPDEISLNILSYLSQQDIHENVALVSTKWKKLSREQRFGPKCVLLTDRDKSRNLRSESNGRMKNTAAIRYFGGTIEHVIMTGCTFDDPENFAPLENLAAKCVNLNKLTIVGGFYGGKISDFFTTLTPLKKTLRSIEFTAEFNSDIGDYHVEEALRFVSESEINELRLELPFEFKYNGGVLPTKLKKLEISDNSVYFFPSNGFCNQFAKLLVEANQNTLTDLKLQSLFDGHFAAIVRGCENLKSFELLNPRDFQKHAFSLLARNYVLLRNITNLVPLNCDFVRLSGLVLPTDKDMNMAEWSYFKNVKSVKMILECGGFLDQEGIFRIDDIQAAFPLLTELILDGNDYSFFGEYVAEEHALIVASKFPTLKTLKLGARCEDIPFTFWRRAMRELPHLNKIKIDKKVDNWDVKERDEFASDFGKAPCDGYKFTLKERYRGGNEYFRFVAQRKVLAVSE